MENEKATIKDQVHPNLLVSPHIMSKLIQIVLGDLHPDSSEQEHIVEHLHECEFCRASLIVLLSAEREYERLNEANETRAHNLLLQFVTLHHEIAIHDYEHMGAYAEAIKAVGRKEAAKRYPVLAEHSKRCASCKAWLEDILAFLKEPEWDN